MIRRIAAFFCAIALLFSLSPVRAESSEEPARLRLVAAVFPAYDFARVIAGDAAEVTLLLPPGADAHSYEPTPQDMIAIQNADLFLYTGGESDTWLERVLASLGDDAPETFAMADCVTLLEEEHSQSMAPEHDHDHDEDGHEEMDEHVWTSPKNVQLIVRALREKLCALSPENAERFTQNEVAYQQKLQALDERFETIVAEGKRNLIVFGDRFPFRYFAAAYGLRYDAVFQVQTFSRQTLQNLSGGTLDLTKQQNTQRPSVVIRRISENAALWDLARQYRTTAQSIQQANHLTQPEADAGRLLLIPM